MGRGRVIMAYMAGRHCIPLVVLWLSVGVSVGVRGGEEPEGKPGPLEVFRSVAAAVIGVGEEISEDMRILFIMLVWKTQEPIIRENGMIS